MSTKDPLYAKAKNRQQRNGIRNGVRILGKRNLTAIGPVFEATALNHFTKRYAELFKEFNLAYVETATRYNREGHAVEADPYWFHKRYKRNWPLRAKRLWRWFTRHSLLATRYSALTTRHSA
jgi:hypothetical protein